MKTIINENNIYLSDCKASDIAKVEKGLKLLNQSVTKIIILARNFDFDTKYYYRFKEEDINKIYSKCKNEVEVTLKNNRLYLDGIILPDDIIIYAEIYFKRD